MTSSGKEILIRNNAEYLYSICINNSWDRLSSLLEAFDPHLKRACIVTDSNIQPLYGHILTEQLKPCFREVYIYAFPAGEEHKNSASITDLYRFLISHNFDRNDILIAFGGGVTGDMTGFAAATYMRGIKYIQVPTTLLSQVDSSIGGKTGFDLDGYKNIIGAFCQPSLVYINTEVLNTLSDLQFASGMGEIVKHGLIRSNSYYSWLKEHHSEIQSRDSSALQEMIRQSCLIKASVVEKDPEEKKERVLLNFGHTIGHAVERESGFQMTHGSCVAVGSAAASYLSMKRGYLTSDELRDIQNTFTIFDLPVTVTDMDPGHIFQTTKNDKKMHHGQIRFILLSSIGSASVCDTVTDEELYDAISYIIKDE